MVNITSSVNSRERSGINTILHELNPLFTINVTMRDIKSKNVDRKSGSAGMPRPTSYAVFCLKKKTAREADAQGAQRCKVEGEAAPAVEDRVLLSLLPRPLRSTLFPYTTLFRSMVNITSSVNSRERSGINTILHELNPLFTINVTMRDIKSKNVYSRVNSKATTQWRKTESANGVHLEGVASDNRSS